MTFNRIDALIAMHRVQITIENFFHKITHQRPPMLGAGAEPLQECSNTINFYQHTSNDPIYQLISKRMNM